MIDIPNDVHENVGSKEVSVVIWWTAGLIFGYILGQCSLLFSVSLNKINHPNDGSAILIRNSNDNNEDQKKSGKLKIIESSDADNNENKTFGKGGKVIALKKQETVNNDRNHNNDTKEENTNIRINTRIQNGNRASYDYIQNKGSLIGESGEKHVDIKKRIRSDSIATQTSEISTNSEKPSGDCNTDNNSSTPRYLEMLIHNVSHTDLVLGVNYCSNNLQDEEILCRPRFSAFDSYCRRVHKTLSHKPIKSSMIRNYPRVRRSSITPHYTLSTPAKKSTSLSNNVVKNDVALRNVDQSSFLNSKDEKYHAFSIHNEEKNNINNKMLPVGFQLASSGDNKNIGTLNDSDFQNLRIRGRDISRLKPQHVEKLWMNSTLVSPRSPRVIAYDKQISIQSNDNKHNNILDTVDQTLSTSQSDIHDTTEQQELENLRINAVYFPLLSCLMRRWNTQINHKFPQRNKPDQADGKTKVKPVIILVTGVGTPRNYTHDIHGNSTQACAELMETYIRILYPDVNVVKIHSQTNIFKYDENITFANEELMPRIDAYRDAHARGQAYPDEVTTGDNEHGLQLRTHHHSYDPDWKQSFNVTLSFADGSPARTHAIQAALRSYRPTYFHFWQLKTFWHESKICDDDIEEHSFEDMETVPAMEASNLKSKEVQMLVEEMDKFKRHFLKCVTKKETDIAKFWLRKTKKPVLAVLLVNQPGKGLIIYRGTNMEVSMPTGSLCAERNVIGTALASDPSLKREDLLMVAVLAVPLKTFEFDTKSDDVSVRPLHSLGRDMLCLPVKNTSVAHTSDNNGNSFNNQCSTITHGKLAIDFSEKSSPARNNTSQKMTQDQGTIKRSISLGSFASVIEHENNYEEDDINNDSALSGADQTIKRPLRRIKLYNKNTAFLSNSKLNVSTEAVTSASSQRKNKSVIVHSHEDINPLRPCGACNEWLKKIAECNPHFKVVTFTDMDCNGVYVSSCQD